MFWIRRALRILPLAYLYLFVLMGVAFSGADLEELKNPRVAFMYFCYLANLRIAAGGWPPGVLAILWSLAIEEQFYAAWPLAVRRLSVSALLWACGGFVLAAPCALPFGPSYPGHAPRLLSVLGYSLVAIAFVCLVGVAVQPGRWARRVVTNRVLMWFGRRCYGLYLWHYLVGSMLHRMLGPTSPFTFGYYGSVAVWLAATTFVATLSWSLFEAPFLRLKRRLAA